MAPNQNLFRIVNHWRLDDFHIDTIDKPRYAIQKLGWTLVSQSA